MQKKWLILTIIVLIYLPVTIDATVMHVATPSLSTALNLTANQLLWIIDIYSLIMAGLIFPMGALVVVFALKNYYLLEPQFLVWVR
ncbi:putative membrane protein [Acinetobacter baumannii 466760]|nr:putative membrane protein [Acinetobacter baumannii 466760]